MSMHLDIFGLDAEPFSKELDDKDLWLPPSKQALVDELVEAVEARASVVLTAKKTCSGVLPTRPPCGARW